ncbi:hypothetical protein Taro_039230 [Colocasia esculenta]|uniref:Subtilisin-like protease n=1 Tax=Colocasia esculenta TaxID=4460 RepID=A0A843WA55_COLES|nr:hypothetical protein [Colocasia esculenta]
MDRDFPAFVKLGDGLNITGISLYGGRRSLSTRRQYPLVYLGGDGSADHRKSQCLEGALKPDDVAGKIVLCDEGFVPREKKGYVVKQAGALGMILANALGEELTADSHLLPAVNVGAAEGKAIKEYVKGSPRPTATLAFAGTRLGLRPSPVVAKFSSRGPNILTSEILKPDVVGPGVNILAAWSGAASPSAMPEDHRRFRFNIISGTSMSCPHVAALLRARHPNWKPAAIRSALMTTAYVHDNTLQPLKDAATGAASTHYAHGAGHINPSKALDPGLVYDLGRQDYINFLCTLKLTPYQLKIFTRSSNESCRHALASPGDLNYPAISASLPASSQLTVHRTVTNIAAPVSTYHVSISPFKGAAVEVEPSTLRFTRKKQKLQYSVTFIAKSPQQTSPEFGALIWTDRTHMVRSPVVITYPATV